MKTITNLLTPVDLLASLVNLLALLAAVGLLVLHKNLPSQVPLWFSLNWGQSRLAQPTFLWLLPTLIFVFFITSHIAAKKIVSKQPVLARILVWSTSFISLIFLIALYKAVLLAI